MANPQKEDGHTRIANEIFDQFCTITLSSREWNILFFVIRKTWGWNKKFDDISLSQFRKGCHMNQSQVCKVLKHLVSRKILLKEEFGYCFNKNYEQWVVSPETPPVSPVSSITGDNLPVSPETPPPVSPETHTIYNYSKNTITKDIVKTPKQKMLEFLEIMKEKSDKYHELVLKIATKKKISVEKVQFELEKFVNTWTEKNNNGTKQRWQLKETFEVDRRLGTWFSDKRNNYGGYNQRPVGTRVIS